MTDLLLTLLIVVPVVGAVLCSLIPDEVVPLRMLSALAGGVMAVEFVLSLMLLTGNYETSTYQFSFSTPWVAELGISYRVGVDGISLWLVLLTTLLSPIALFASVKGDDRKQRGLLVSFLALEAAMIGTFVALDLFLFYVFWELMLVPMYFIVGIWGGRDRMYAAVKFFLYTMAGSLLMLVAILYVVAKYHEVTGVYSFNVDDLWTLSIPLSEQFWLFGAFALAFAIKVPMFPFHTWLPDAHVQAPTGGSVVLAAVMLKLGTYGFVRFAIPLFPYATHELGPTLAMLSVVGILYGAFCAWVQGDVKKLVAYSSVSHLGFVMLGIFALNLGGVSGAVLQMLNHGVSTGALFILVGVIYDRRRTRNLSDFGGLAKVMPTYALLFVVVTMSSIGLPGTNGFVGEFMIMSGAFLSSALQPWPRVFVILAALGVIFAAVYMLHAVLKMFWGPLDKKENEGLQDVAPRELVLLAPLVVLIFWVGVFPRTFLEPMEQSVATFVRTYNEKLVATYSNDSLRVLNIDRSAKSGVPVAVAVPLGSEVPR